MNKRALFLATAALVLFDAPAESLATSSGYDTANGLDLIFGVNGTEVGDWSTTQLAVTGGLSAVGEIASTLNGIANFRMIPQTAPAGYGAFFRNDSTNTYLLLTNQNDSLGLWNNLRPFIINDSTGMVILDYGGYGKVGINTNVPTAELDVGGGVRTGYDNDACSAVNEGTQRYNVSIHNYEFCNGISWAPLGQSDPSGEVAFFLAYTCPSGWNPSDGTNGTIDMRGEFPRGLDNGRGVDPGRALGSWEDATGIGQTVIQAAFVQFWNPDAQIFYGGNQQRAGLNGYVNNQVMFKVRPRNVALLACAKI